MEEFISLLRGTPLLALVVMIAAGLAVGRLSVSRVSLGTSGVLFAGMLFGHLGVRLPEIVGQIGVLLFVYSVGLQAGPQFFRSLRRHGVRFVALTLVTLAAAFAVAVLASWAVGVDPVLASGLFAGALTSTPALAASLDALGDPHVAIGFGVAYPIGVVGVILFVQLAPRVLRIDWDQETQRASRDDAQPPNEVAWLEVANPRVAGRTIGELEELAHSTAVVSRVLDRYVAMPPHPETQLALGQRLRIVGGGDALRDLEVIVGPRCDDFHEPRSAITSVTVVVTADDACGKTLHEMAFRERHGVTITRLWRDDFEFIPDGAMRLEFGDEVRLVGDADDCHRVVSLLGYRAERINETRFLPLSIGLLAGLLLARLPLPAVGGVAPTLGLAGGPLLAGLLAGHFGTVGPLTFRTPIASRLFMNELGLILFLASAGVDAGGGFWTVVSENGATMLLVGALITVLPMLAAFSVARYAFGWNALRTLGAVCGAMTCTPGLGVLSKQSNSAAPSTAYVAVYPMALVFVSVLGPFVAIVLRLLG